MVKLLKIALGCTVSILIADFMGLGSGTAAGIITLLSIRETSQETVVIAGKRLLGFFLATLIAYGTFTVFGYHAPAFGLFLFLFVFLCGICSLQEAVSMNAVLTTHYLLAGSMPATLIINEFFLLLIGAGCATLINLYMPSKLPVIRQMQHSIEDDMRLILTNMADRLNLTTVRQNTQTSDPAFSDLERHLEEGTHYAHTHYENRFRRSTEYFIFYMDMRRQQTAMLHNIDRTIQALPVYPPQCAAVSSLIRHTAHSFAESNDAALLLAEWEEIMRQFQNSALPCDRAEFEARAILYILMQDFVSFLRIKADFHLTKTGE